MFPEHCSVTQSASAEWTDVVCDVPHRPSRGLVWRPSADWLICWSCGWRTPVSCSSKQDLVGGPGKCMRHRVGMRGGERGEKSMCGLFETPGTVVSVDKTFFLIFWISVPYMVNRHPTTLSALSFLCRSFVRECDVSCSRKCPSKVQTHLMLQCWLSQDFKSLTCSNSADGLNKAPTHTFIMAAMGHTAIVHTLTRITHCRSGAMADPICW